mgnify:CR=1 FL=1
MNIVVLTENRKIEYLDLPSGTDAEEFVANHYPLNKVSWGEYEEEEVVYNDCQLCIEEEHNHNRINHLETQMEQVSKQIIEDAWNKLDSNYGTKVVDSGEQKY